MSRENSGTEQGCQLTCRAVRLNHGFGASLRPRETRCLPTRAILDDLIRAGFRIRKKHRTEATVVTEDAGARMA
jgi:hypothetical protein